MCRGGQNTPKVACTAPQMGPQPPMPTQDGEAMPKAMGDSLSPTDGDIGACETGDVRREPVHNFGQEDTVFIFDWDDTVLPSTWVQKQGLSLDDSIEITLEQREQLTELAATARETLIAAKRRGTVVLVTNAERGWIELSCARFMPTLAPALEGIKLLSARTTYETSEVCNPLDWKVLAFESEIQRIYGCDVSAERRKNVLSLGDSLHEREALLRVTAQLPNCRAKSLKFVERPDITQICKQHAVVTSCFDRIIHHDGNLDLCITCT